VTATKKKESRVITGWRQVLAPGSGSSKTRSSPLTPRKPAPRPPIATGERSANERWEAEGGHLNKATVLKIPVAD